MKSGWELKKLGEVCEYKSGTTISPILEKPNGAILYVKVGDMNILGNEDYITVSSRYVDRKDINANQIIPTGSIIFPKRGGAIATNKKRRIVLPTIVDLNTMALVPSKIIDNDYLFFWFKQIDLATLSNGTSIPQINNYSFDNVFISYPKSIPEQQRIVAILDEAFEAIDQAKANTEKNLQNARELFQSELNSIFTNKGEGWVERKLGDVLHRTETINPLLQAETEFIYIDVSSVNKETLLIEDVNFIKGKDAPSRARKFIKTNDVIFATVRPTLKRIAIIPEEYNEQICSTGYFVLRASDMIDFRMLFYYLQTFYFQDKMEKLQKGASYPAVTDNEVRQQIIKFPTDKKVQQGIVHQLDALSSETKKLEENYRKKQESLEELKKSILQKAFSGELTNPERARSDSDGCSPSN
jgi:type I restriction enzyme S subunit